MATGTLDLTNTLPTRMAAMGLSVEALSVYTSISPSQLRRLFAGTVVSSNTMLEIKARLNELESLRNLCWPIPISLNAVKQVGQLIERLRDQKTVIKIQNEDRPVEQDTFTFVEIPGIKNGMKE